MRWSRWLRWRLLRARCALWSAQRSLLPREEAARASRQQTPQRRTAYAAWEDVQPQLPRLQPTRALGMQAKMSRQRGRWSSMRRIPEPGAQATILQQQAARRGDQTAPIAPGRTSAGTRAGAKALERDGAIIAAMTDAARHMAARSAVVNVGDIDIATS